jgi:Tfp pilus assembly protein PilX
MRRRRRETRRGFALLLSLLLLLVLTIAGIGLLFGTSTERSLSNTETKISKTFYAADTGIAYAAAAFRTNAAYAGGPVPPVLSSNLPGRTSTPDIAVNVTPPQFVAYAIQPRDEFQSQGNGYGTLQIVEASYEVTSTATSTVLGTEKSVSAHLAVYPQQLQTP